MKTIFDAGYNNDEFLYQITGAKFRNKDDSISIYSVLPDICFTKKGVLQQKIIVTHQYRSWDSWSGWNSTNYYVWVDVPSE